MSKRAGLVALIFGGIVFSSADAALAQTTINLIAPVGAYTSEDRGFGIVSTGVVVVRSGDLAGTSSVVLTTHDGTAIAGSDYLAVTTTVVFAPGETEQFALVPFIADTLVEGAEFFTVSISNPSGAVLGPKSTTNHYIIDNDPPGSVDLWTTKTPSNPAPGVGSTLDYAINVQNLSFQTATNVTIQDILPPGVTFLSASSTQGGCSGTSTITCNLGTIGTIRSADVTISVRVDRPGPIVNTATATATQTLQVAAHAGASATVNAIAVPALSTFLMIALGLTLALIALRSSV